MPLLPYSLLTAGIMAIRSNMARGGEENGRKTMAGGKLWHLMPHCSTDTWQIKETI